MALVRRGNRVYLYQTERRGSLRKTRYVACGPEAEALAYALHTARLVARQDRLLLGRQRNAELDAMLRADAEIDRVCEDIQLLARAILIASGFHTHKGQLRRRRYTQQVRASRPRSRSRSVRLQGQSRKPGQGRPRSAPQAAPRNPAIQEAAKRPCAHGLSSPAAEPRAQHRRQTGVKSRDSRLARSLQIRRIAATRRAVRRLDRDQMAAPDHRRFRILLRGP